jgi:hypothetical protein
MRVTRPNARTFGGYSVYNGGQMKVLIEEDHNILAVRSGERFEITPDVQDELRDFVLNVFADIPGKRIAVGRFLGKEAALSLVAATRIRVDSNA